LADAADITGSIRVSTNPPDTLTFEAKWAAGMALGPARTDAEPLVTQHPLKRASAVASLVPAGRAGPQIAAATPENRVTPPVAAAPVAAPTTPVAAPTPPAS